MWADKKGSGRVRAPGELILEYLFGKMSSKLISLPTLAAAVDAAAAAFALQHSRRAVVEQSSQLSPQPSLQPLLQPSPLPPPPAVTAVAAVAAGECQRHSLFSRESNSTNGSWWVRGPWSGWRGSK